MTSRHKCNPDLDVEEESDFYFLSPEKQMEFAHLFEVPDLSDSRYPDGVIYIPDDIEDSQDA